MNHPKDLHRVLTALEAGDPAFIHTFIRMSGRSVAQHLERCGVGRDHLDDLVQEVALTVAVGAEAWDPATRSPWSVVESGIRRVLEEHGYDPDAGPAPTVDIRRVDLGETRSLHLIDVENFGGGRPGTAARVHHSLDEYQAVVPVGVGDQVLIAADVDLYKRVAFGARGCRLLPGYGEDGADRALLDAAPAEWVVDRFERLVIGSGDGIFAGLAAVARRSGMVVVVVSRPECLSGALADSASEIRRLEPMQAALDLRFLGRIADDPAPERAPSIGHEHRDLPLVA